MVDFIIAFAAVIATLYAPGYLIGRTFALAHSASLALAPAFTIALLVGEGVVLYAANISCPAPMLAGVALAIALVTRAVAWIVGRRANCPALAAAEDHSNASPLTSDSAFTWKAFALYVGVALIIITYVFLTAIDGLDSFARKDDTTVHLSVVRAFLDSGTYSTLHSGSFTGQSTTGSYYPSAWHIVVAIAASCINSSVTLATNATTLAFTAVVLPLGLCLLLSTVFPARRNVVLAGSLFSVAFAIMPWGFLTKGQLLPNMMSYTFIPGTIALFITAIESARASRRAALSVGVAWMLVSIALCQPNGAFTCVIGMASYAICRIFRAPHEKKATFTPKRIGGAVAFVVALCALWVALFYAPPLRGVVTYGQWDTLLTFPEAVLAGLSFMYVEWGGIQPFLSIVVLFGAIAVFRDRRYLWLVVAYLVTLVIYLANMATEGFPRQLFAGFWYADYYRTGAMNALFAIPLAAFGFAWLVKLVAGLLARIPALKSRAVACTALAAVVLVAAFAICQTADYSFKVGKRTVAAGLPYQRQQIENLYTWETTYTTEERAFVQQARAMVGNDDCAIINVPNDGTAWCYGTDGLRVLFRRTGDNGSNSFPKETNKIIRTQLANIATDPAVQQAVRDVDARYVILLDDPSGENPTKDPSRYEEEKWRGVESITPDTPGFTLLLSEGDMRFYEIDSAPSDA